MAYGIGRDQKLGKQNIKWIYNTTDPSSAPSTHSYIDEKLNENIDITSKKLLTAETYYSTTFALDDKSTGIIQT